MEKSDFFTLLVTPNILEEGNYVKTVEYPAALDAGMNILPAQMVETDKERLKENYKKLEPVIDAWNELLLHEKFSACLKNIQKHSDDDPQHEYLLGLAYLDGIDVEKDADYAVGLITKAADAELPEAMEKLCDIYKHGDSVERDYNKVLEQTKKIYEYNIKRHGEEHPETLSTLNTIVTIYGCTGEYGKALELSRKCYELRKKVLGEEHPDTLNTLNNVAISCRAVGDYDTALELYKKCYELRRKVLGENHPDTVRSLKALETVKELMNK